MANKKWRQCIFRKKNSFTHAWIDSKAAKVGNKVQLLSLDGDFWDVIFAGNIVDVLPPFTFENNI